MTIRNPIEWGWSSLKSAAHSIEERSHDVTREPPAAPSIRRITVDDLRDCIRRGIADFKANRTDIAAICIIYPLAGIVLARLAFGYAMLPLIFPIVAGFALVGPIAAVPLYEMSRRRELHQRVTWLGAFGAFRSASAGSIVVMGAYLLGIFLFWLLVAQAIYDVTLGPDLPSSVGSFLHDVFATGMGWLMIVVGIGVGFLFAVAVLAISVVSLPMLLDRNVGVEAAILTSVRAVRANPGVMAVWGFIVAAGLVLGSIPLLLGLIVVMPVLGHATWHLYRKVVAR